MLRVGTHHVEPRRAGYFLVESGLLLMTSLLVMSVASRLAPRAGVARTVHLLWGVAITFTTEAALYLALAPKSNSALTSYGAARELIQETGNEPVPMHLRNAPTGLMKSMGYGKGYQYAHDIEGGVAREQVHMPERLKGRKVYRPNPRDKSPSPAKRERGLSGFAATPA